MGNSRSLLGRRPFERSLYTSPSVAFYGIRGKNVKEKAAIVYQGFVPGYRVRFYELLNRIGAINLHHPLGL